MHRVTDTAGAPEISDSTEISGAPAGPASIHPGSDPEPATDPTPTAPGAAGLVRAAQVVLTLAIVSVVVGVSLWFVQGGRTEIISSPSMGRVAPVGTLVITEPTDHVVVGDVVTARPPVPNHPKTVTHRVVAVDASGAISTRGDINGANDPWTLHSPDLVGKATALLPGMGWLVRAAPVLAIGFVLLWWATARFRSRFWTVPVRVLGSSLLVSGVAMWLKPFVSVVTLGTSGQPGTATIAMVSTGLLPTRVAADTGGVLDLVDGQVGRLVTPLAVGARGNVLTSGVHMPWWLWVLVTAVWLLPMVYGLVAAWRRPLVDPAEPAASAAGDDPGEPSAPADVDPDAVTAPIHGLPAVPVTASTVRTPGPTASAVRSPLRRLRRWSGRVATAATLTVVLTTVLSVLATATTSAFVASVRNSTDTAATAPYFTCDAAFTGIASTAYIDWPLDDATVTSGSTARALSNSATTGTYTNAFTTTTSTPCTRDTNQRAVTLAPTSDTAGSYVTPTNATAIKSSNVFSEALWFNTSTARGGRMMGWSTNQTGLTSNGYDRHIYMTNAGNLVFGVYPNAVKTIASPLAYNDGKWHLVVATLSTAGMVLYVDGAQVAADTTTTTAEGGTANNGYWRVGYDNLNGWTSQPTTNAWAGSLSRAAVYSSALTATQVKALYTAGTGAGS